MTDRPLAITKVLSMNDTGETGGHQAGILVPKGGDVLRFFPDLGNDVLNPRAVLYFVDETGNRWKFSFIYYNNRFFTDNGTRNEYRLTGMTRYLRENGLKAGDSITLIHDDSGIDMIRYRRYVEPVVETIKSADGTTRKRLTIGSGWKVIEY